VPALPIDPGLASPGRWRGRLHALLERTAVVAVLPDDPEEERVRKAALILFVALIVPLSSVWVVTYAALGLWWSAVIPLAYQVLSTVGLAGRVPSQQALPAVPDGAAVPHAAAAVRPPVEPRRLPGLQRRGNVAFVAPMAALVFVGPGRAWWWLAAAQRTLRDGEPIRLRIGIDSGPVVAGVIGRRKFIYDLWGDTVNTASRMESHGVPGHIQVTERVRGLLADRFVFRERGTIEVKGKGPMQTYFLLGRPRRPRRCSFPVLRPARRP
jgi:Adenylate and Guanylate cyclase catalytic domain